jgi:hypothetical protein
VTKIAIVRTVSRIFTFKSALCDRKKLQKRPYFFHGGKIKAYFFHRGKIKAYFFHRGKIKPNKRQRDSVTDSVTNSVTA